MPEIITLLLVLLIGVATGFFDSAIGSGGLISVPSLIFLGLPPQIAIATDRFGTLGQISTALFKFWKAQKIIWKFVPILATISLLGSLIGANILLNINPKILGTIVGIVVLILLPFIFLKRRIGIQRIKTSKSRKLTGLLIYFLIMIFGGFFGAGSGLFIFYALTFFLGFTIIDVLATSIIPWFVLSASSLIIFALNSFIDYKIGIVLLGGMAIGGYLGAHVVLKKGNMWAKRLFVLLVIILGLKLLFF